MSDRIGLLLKMLLPSVAISIAIKYFSTSMNPVPTLPIVLSAVLLPSILLGVALLVKGQGSGMRGEG
jgi:hypothetical protein